MTWTADRRGQRPHALGHRQQSEQPHLHVDLGTPSAPHHAGRASDVLVLFDEAYIQFNTAVDTSVAMDLFREYPNVVVAHTFSKAYGRPACASATQSRPPTWWRA